MAAEKKVKQHVEIHKLLILKILKNNNAPEHDVFEEQEVPCKKRRHTQKRCMLGVNFPVTRLARPTFPHVTHSAFSQQFVTCQLQR